jgi:uncharacterized protein
MGRSELHYAAVSGSGADAQALMDAGQDPNLRDRNGFVPLHLAAQEWNVEVAHVLLNGGASVDAVNRFGNSPLFVAVFSSRGRGEMIDLLREFGADPLLENSSGQTPLGLSRLIANYNVARFFEDLPG